MNADVCGSVAGVGAARLMQLVVKQSAPLNTFLFLMPLTVEVRIPDPQSPNWTQPLPTAQSSGILMIPQEDGTPRGLASPSRLSGSVRH